MIVYFDSGTTNSRCYLLTEDAAFVDHMKIEFGSKNSAIMGNNAALLQKLHELYSALLTRNGCSDEDVTRIYASGMVTSPYGIQEVPHVTLPVDIPSFARHIHPHFEDRYFHREIRLVPGLRTTGESIDHTNNLRGEEIEAIGANPRLAKQFGAKPVAVVLPGSHTHTILMRNGAFEDLLANFTGELYSALQSTTILAPILNIPVETYDPEMVSLGVENLRKYGFTRALYICHAMQLFNRETAIRRASYAEGVILGGLCQALDCCCTDRWKDVENIAIVADSASIGIYEMVLKNCRTNLKIHSFEISKNWIPSLEGIRILMNIEKGNVQL